MFPSPFPTYDPIKEQLQDGIDLNACSHCRKVMVERNDCADHYRSLTKRPEGYYKCPFGFTTRSFFFDGQIWMITGVIAFPRFDEPDERRMAKRFRTHKVTRASIDAAITYLRMMEAYKSDAIQEAGRYLPQAFHELRKLNRAVLQHAEREIRDRGETRSLISIVSAAELMKNNFDILEALSNIESMRALPSDSTVNVFDLVFKMKRVLQERAEAQGIHIQVNGVRAIIRGSQKSFPIVPAVLLENAIKYGKKGRPIVANIAAEGVTAVLSVENETDGVIDPERCFERGARFSSRVEGGGFGLFLAKEIVACHNGRIYCETGPGTVRMVVEIPLKTVISDYPGKQ